MFYGTSNILLSFGVRLESYVIFSSEKNVMGRSCVCDPYSNADLANENFWSDMHM